MCVCVCWGFHGLGVWVWGVVFVFACLSSLGLGFRDLPTPYQTDLNQRDPKCWRCVARWAGGARQDRLLPKPSDLYRGLDNYNRASSKGVYKGSYKGSIVGFYNIRSLIIRIGFWGPLYQNYHK